MFKQVSRVFALLVLLAIPAFATQVTVVASQIPQAQVPGLPADVTGTASVSNGSADITLTTNFRTAWVGLSGYLINLPAGDFYVSSTASGGVLTLSTAYTGSSGTVTYRVYPFVYLRIYANRSYTPLGASYVVQPGTPGSSSWYVNKAVSVKSGQFWLPALTLDATIDAVNPAEQQARLSAFFYKQDGSLIAPYACFNNFRVPTDTPTTWTALCSYNQTQTPNPPDTNTYTATQINNFIPACTAGQMTYYAGTGRAQSCLTVGAGLSISSGTITSSGGGGSGSWSALTAPTGNLSLSHSAWSTTFTWNTNTGSATLFSLETGANDVGTGYLAQFTTPGGGNTKSPLRVSAHGSDSLIVTAMGLVGVNRGSPVAQLDVLAGTTSTPAGRFNVPSSSISDILQLQNNGTSVVRFVPVGTTVNSVFGNAALATNATDGFPYIPSTAGTPSGTPTSYTGQVPLVFNSSTNHLYGYSGGSWRDLTTAGGGGGGSSVWSDLLQPTANLSLNMYSGGTNYTTAFNWNSATALASLFTFTTGTNDTGAAAADLLSGAVVNIFTPGATNTKPPLQITTRGINAMHVNYDGRVYFGEQMINAANASEYFVVDMTYPNQNVALRSHGNSAFAAPALQLERTRGTAAANTSVQSGDILGKIEFLGKAGTGIGVYGASIFAWATDTVIGGAIPASLVFQTAPVGTLINRMVISHDGTVGIPTNTAAQFSVYADSPTRAGILLRVDATGTITGDALAITDTSANTHVRIAPVNNLFDVVLGGAGGASLGTSSAGGYTFIATMADQPASTPTSRPGTAPLVLENDTTNGEYRLWSYLNGQWRNLSGSGGGGGPSVWSSLTSPTANLSLGMSTYRTTMEWAAGTGTSTNLFTLTTNTITPEPDTGYLFSVETPGLTNAKSPFRVLTQGATALAITADAKIGFGAVPSNGFVQISKQSDTGLPVFYKGVTVGNTGALAAGLYSMEHLLVTDFATGNYQALVGNRVQFVKNALATSTAAIIVGEYIDMSFAQSHSGDVYSLYIAGPAVSSAKTVTKHIGLLMDPPTGAGTTTTGYGIVLNPGIGPSGFGLGGPTAQLHVVSGSASRVGLTVSSASTPTADVLQIQNNTTTKVKFAAGATTTTEVNSVFGNAALSTSATDGYVWLPTTTGAPTGTPTSYTGTAAIILREQVGNNKLYGYLGGNWVDLSGGAGGSTAWDSLTNPASANLSLSMAALTTTFTWSATSGASSNLFNIANGSNDTGTGYLMTASTPGASNAKSPLQVSARGTTTVAVVADGKIGLGGITAPTTRLHVGDATGSTTTVMVQGSGSSAQANLYLATSQGTLGSPTALGTGEQSGTVAFQGANGSNAFTTIAAVGAGLDGANHATNPPGYLSFYTRASGSGSLSGRVTIDSNGRVGIPLVVSATQLAIQGQAASDVVLVLNTTSSPSGDILKVQNNSTSVVRFVPGGSTINSVFQSAALATSATNGFVYLPTTTDTPSGTPTSFTGTGPIVLESDTTNAQYYLWAYLNGSWRNLTNGGGGSSVWSSLTNPAANLSLSMAAYTSTFTWNAATGTTNNLWNMVTGSDDTGTGYVVSIETPGSSNAKSPFRIQARGTDTLLVGADGNVGIGPAGLGSGASENILLSANSRADVVIRGAASAVAFGTSQYFQKAETSVTSPSDATTSSFLHNTFYQAYQSSAYRTVAESRIYASGTFGASDYSAVWVLGAVPTGTTTTSSVLTLTGSGIVVEGGATTFTPTRTPTASLDVLPQTAALAGIRVNSAASATGSLLYLQHNGTTKVQFTPVAGGAVNSVFGSAALATNATDGFVYLPTTTDTPSGTPTSFTGTSAVVVENDTGNAQYYLWGYVNGGWRNLTGTGGGSTVWSALTAPSGNLSISHASNTTSMSWGATTSTNNLWTFTNSSNDTGTNYLVSVETPGASNAKAPFRIYHQTGTFQWYMDNLGFVWHKAFGSSPVPTQAWFRAKNSEGSGSGMALSSGDVLGQFRFMGAYDNSSTINNFNIGAIIQADASGNWDGTNKATDLRFRTGNLTASTPTNTLILTSDQRAVIGSNVVHADATETFNVLGTSRTTGLSTLGTGDGSGLDVPSGMTTPTALYIANGTSGTPSTSTSPAMTIMRRWNATAVGGSGAGLSIHVTNDKANQGTMEVVSVWSRSNQPVDGDRIGIASRMVSEGVPGTGTSDFAIWGIDQKSTRVDASATEMTIDNQYVRTVTAATNATPIAITVSVAHYLATGDEIYITGVNGNTAANGSLWTITVTGSTTFTLNGSVGNGPYTSGGTVSLHSARDYGTAGNRAIAIAGVTGAPGNYGNATVGVLVASGDTARSRFWTGIDIRPDSIATQTLHAIRIPNDNYLSAWNNGSGSTYKLIGLSTGDKVYLDRDGRTIQAGTGPTVLTDAAGKILSAALNTVAVAQGGTGQTVASSARAYNSGAISTTTGVEQALTFDSERYDTNGLHSTSSNTGRLTAPVAGTYVITANVTFASNATGLRYAYIRINGGSILGLTKIPNAGAGGLDDWMTVTTNYQLAANDYVEVVVFQNSGGNLNITSAGNHSPEFSMVRVSD